MNIKSEFLEEAFYQLFEKNDIDYAIPFQGKEQWLNRENPMVEIEIDAKLSTLKVGFRRHASHSGEWIAKPVLIKTNRAILLTKDGKIQQVDAALLQIGHLSDANFLDNDKMRPMVGGMGKAAGLIIGKIIKESGLADATKGFLQGIPYAGIIAALADVIWPKPSVSSLINDAEIRMRNMIISKIRHLDLATQKGALSAVRDNLHEYKNATGASRRTWMEASLATFNLVKGELLNMEKEYTPGSVYLARDMAGLHLGMLRERISFEKEIFGSEKVNTEENLNTLKRTIKEYQDYLDYGIKAEVVERKSQIKVSYQNSPGLGPRGIGGEAMQIRMLIRDNVRREIHRFSVEGSFNQAIMNKPNATQIKDIMILKDLYFDQVEREIEIRLHEDIFIPSMLLDWFVPGQESIKPTALQKEIVSGPLTGLLLRDFNYPLVKPIKYLSGKVSNLRFIQIIYMSGAIIPNFGYDDGGKTLRFSMGEKIDNKLLVQFEKKLDDKIYINRIESWWDRYPMAVRLYFSDGTSTKRLGKASGGEYQVAGIPHHGICQDLLGEQNEARKYGFRLMPSFYDISIG